MGAVSEAERDVLEPHIPSGEKLIEAYSGEQQTVAVTDRRVLDLSHSADNKSQETALKSILLTSEYVVGTEYSRSESTESPVIEVIAGVGLLVIGAGMAILGVPQSDWILGAGGMVALVLGVLVLVYAQDETNGDVTVTVHRAEELPDQTWSFPRGETEVAQAVTERVAALNGPK